MADRTALYLITRFILAQQRNPYERRLKPSALPARQAMDISASVRDQNLNLRGIPSLLENFYGFFYPRFAYPHQLANSDNVFGELRAQYSSLNYVGRPDLYVARRLRRPLGFGWFLLVPGWHLPVQRKSGHYYRRTGVRYGRCGYRPYAIIISLTSIMCGQVYF